MNAQTSGYAQPRPHPTLSIRVTEPQRARAEQYLQQAYAEGRLEHDEFSARMETVLKAQNRGELNYAFYGLVPVSNAHALVGTSPAYAPLVNMHADGRPGRGVASLAHFSFFFAWLIGPALFYALAKPGSYVKKEAAKAFNFQLLAFLGMVGLGMVDGWLPWLTNSPLMALLAVGWIVLTIVGGVKAARGEEWRNPVTRVIPVKVLKEK